MPLRLIETARAVSGMTMPGWIWKPSTLTSWPVASRSNEPSRVYPVRPSGICTTKKPSPCTATSSSFSVGTTLPWLITRGVAAVLTPEPISMPAGTMVPWSEVCDPARR